MKNRISLIVRSSPLFLIPMLLVFLLLGCSSSDSPYTGTIAEAGAAASEAMTESEASGLTLAVVDAERSSGRNAGGTPIGQPKSLCSRKPCSASVRSARCSQQSP